MLLVGGGDVGQTDGRTDRTNCGAFPPLRAHGSPQGLSAARLWLPGVQPSPLPPTVYSQLDRSRLPLPGEG